ncbi:DUF1802 family protein [Anabaena sp. UHCC 0187]|uniref:DUF1802 family protein n=1 Tax=Anabaena sp. UHCC 0187 TaxID=2590018 RepID=UPI0014450E9E|nr:DUF1802 family protein [Anabaena sp. UHCC 0187]MTJ12788.1 DUF1802 family protein [Anabaena sp. UHCC 0187]
MIKSVLIDKALCISTLDFEALIQGRIIVAIPQTLLNSGQKFALYPVDDSANQLSIQKYYRSSFLLTAQTAIKQVNSETVSIKTWAKCERCQMLDKTTPLDILSQLTIWKPERFEEILQNRPHFFLAYLRVYHLPQFIEVPANPNIQDKLGKFVGLPNISASEDKPVLSDQVFIRRKQQLEKREPPLHPELEKLQVALSQIVNNNPAAEQLENEIKVFLGWSNEATTNTIDADLAWIKTIAALGDRSIEQDEGKSNYQAGTDFENVVRQSLEFLGFIVDYFHKGGAGGVDVFCSYPYPLVSECKSGKKIPNTTAVQLLNLGMLRLKSQELFKQATKLIIGPGEPTTQLNDAAKVQDMAIINPETLEKLVQLQSKYRNSIDLFKLKEYLKPGQSDQEVEKYIVQVEQDIKLRSEIIKTVKELSAQNNDNLQITHQQLTVTEIRVHYNAINKQNLTNEITHDLLIELSSPLTGYLGREKGNDGKTDKFYYLRDLSIN